MTSPHPASPLHSGEGRWKEKAHDKQSKECVMDKERIEELIRKYNEGQSDPSEIHTIEQLIEEGVIELSQLSELNRLDASVMKLEFPESSIALDDHFYAMLAKMKKESNGFSWGSFFSWPAWPELAPRLAFASVLLLLGFFVGYWLKPSAADSQQVEQLSQQVTDLKEMMMFSLLEKESATDRLRAVNLTSEMSKVSDNVTSALLQTLNHDDNINVRLAALDMLKPYARDSRVREELVRSIAVQESPLVQLSLAELMVALQEKSSVKEFEKILKSDKTPSDVKRKIEESIKVMI